MSEWEPATDAEVAMRDALRTDDQESYFRILSGADLLLPVSAEALSGRAPLGWGTWSTGGRTHVLAFTSMAALQACLADYDGSARRVPYAELANTWPNLEWWLAVNPGLPIEGYLPAWFVAQLSRGDLRLPTRGPGPEPVHGTQVQDSKAAAVAAVARTEEAAAARPGGPTYDPVPEDRSVPPPISGAAVGADAQQPTSGAPSGPYPQQPGGGAAPDAYGRRPGADYPAAQAGTGAGQTPYPAADAAEEPPRDRTGPGGLPIRTPSGVTPSGLPARTPPAATGSPAAPPAYQPTAVPPVPSSPAAPAVPSSPAGASAPGPVQDPRGPLPVRTPMAQTPPVPQNFRPHDPTETPFEPHWASPGEQRETASAAGDQPGRQPAPPTGQSGFPQGPASPQAAAQTGATAYQPASGPGAPLPRRQAAPPPAQPGAASFPAFQTATSGLAGAPGEANQSPANSALQSPAAPTPVPPVIPGTERPARATTPEPVEGRAAAPVRAAIRPGAPQAPAGPPPERFVPANGVERELLDAAERGNTDTFLSTLLLATVLVPVAHHSRPGSAPGESGFAFRTEEIEGERYLIVFTSKDRLAEHYAEPTRTASVRFYELIRNWPDPTWSFAVNPRGPIGAKYPGPQVIALANWATEAGLGAEPVEAPRVDDTGQPVPAPEPANDEAQHATVMQKMLPPAQVEYYLERGYDRVAGFVHRATEVEHLRTPAELFAALGLGYESSPHQPDAKEAFVLRWPAYRPSLYRIPYGGQNEQALRAMDGWVIERPPFRGNGFAPGEGRDVIAEFKVDSVRLPHGAQLWRIDADGHEQMIAIFDNDGPLWRRVGEQ